MQNNSSTKKRSHISENSVMFEKIIPVLLAVMGILTIALILFAIAVLFGVVHF